MLKYQLALLISCTLAAILFCFVRMKQDSEEIITTFTPSKTKFNQTSACLKLLPYHVINDPLSSKFIICQGGNFKDINLICPKNTIYHTTFKRCEPVDPCYNKENGTLIEATQAVNLPRNRRYHICQERGIWDTRVCPDEKPYFDGFTCVLSDACSYLEEGTKFADNNEVTKYFICSDKKAISRSCPPKHHFSVTHCIPNNMCENEIHGTLFPDQEDSRFYYQCHNQQAIKRKCKFNQRFSPYKRACITYNPCVGKPNTVIPVDNLYLKRSRNVIKCDNDENLSHEQCSNENHIFDETIRQCRDLNLCADLKEGKVFPHSESLFTSCDHETPQMVDITLKINQETGEIIDRCAYMPDGTRLGNHFSANLNSDFVICQNQKANVNTCPAEHYFINEKCTFLPCMLRPTGSFGPMPQDISSFYYCKEDSRHTFTITCPEGTKVSDKYDKCVPDPLYTISHHPFKIESQFSFTDPQGERHSCRDVDRLQEDNLGKKIIVTKVLNTDILKCQDAPCISTLIHNLAFVPMTPHKAAFCLQGSLQTIVDCQSIYVNLQKTFTGNMSLPNCISTQSLGDTDVILRDQGTFYVKRSGAHMIVEDSFTNLTEPAETLVQGLTPIVGPLHPTGATPIPICPANANKVTIPGYPHLFYNCKKKSIESCPKQKNIFFGWICDDPTVYPVFGNCNLFALGRGRIYKGKDNNPRRIFQCPAHVPIFNYLKNKCETKPPTGHLLCENYFFQNYEVYARPHEMYKLPEPKLYSSL